MLHRNPSLVVLALFFSFCAGFRQYASYFAPQPRLFFNFFQRFDNQICITSNSQFGRCMTRNSCLSTGGTSRGICNFGFKTCCQAATTTTTTTRPTTSSPSTASPTMASPTTASSTTPSTVTPPMRSNDTLQKDFIDKLSDSLSIQRLSAAYCQLRIDFTLFKNVGEVDRDGRCLFGQWTASGQNNINNVPTICGNNTGQHVYLNFDEAGTPINMNLVTSLMNSDWSIKATQIACNDRAPPECLQLFPESSGNVKSFNYRTVNVMRNNDTYQPANNNYIVCIGRTPSNFNMISWKRDPSSDLSFSISGISSIADPPNLGGINGASFDNDCTTDFIGINNGKFTNALNQPQTASKFCGIGFPTDVSSAMKPFKLQVFTTAAEFELPSADRGNVGFSLNYTLS